MLYQPMQVASSGQAYRDLLAWKMAPATIGETPAQSSSGEGGRKEEKAEVEVRTLQNNPKTICNKTTPAVKAYNHQSYYSEFSLTIAEIISFNFHF